MNKNSMIQTSRPLVFSCAVSSQVHSVRDTVCIAIWWMSALMPREVKGLTQGHTTSK